MKTYVLHSGLNDMNHKLLPVLTILFVLIFGTENIFGQIFTKVEVPAITQKNTNGYGSGFIDYDYDGKLDIYLNNNGSSSVIFHNNGNDSFSEVPSANLIPTFGSASGLTWGDFDNDTGNDLFLISMDGNNAIVHANGSTATSTVDNNPLPKLSGFIIHSTWVDYDNDGLLDLFIPACGSSSFVKGGGIKNYLFHNDGEGKLTRVNTSAIELSAGNNVCANFADFDNDGDMDLALNDCQQENLIFENVNGTFVKIDAALGTNPNSSISCSWGDYDNDGYIDLFIANGLPSEGGNYPCYLYHNNGNKTFTKITTGELADFRGNNWNGLWGDFDNDGDLDLFIATYSQPDVIFINNGDGTFHKDAEFDMSSRGTSGASIGDYNNDGFLDLFCPNAYGTGQFLFKNKGNKNNWLFVECKGKISNRSAIGAHVKIKATILGKAVWQLREINPTIGFRSVTDLKAHFGLGDATVIDSLIIEWPSKSKTIKINIKTNQVISIEENVPAGYLKADFKSDINKGYGPLKIQFKDISVCDENNSINSWSWDFNGDGIEDSNQKNPEYVFNSYEGISCSVSLTITNNSKKTTVTKNDFIQVLPAYEQNLALSQITTASSCIDNQKYSPSNLVDKNLATFWESSVDSDSQWVQIELDSVRSIGKIILKWGNYYAEKYNIKYSLDGSYWQELLSVDDGNGRTDELDVAKIKAKLVKLYFLRKSSSAYGYRLCELEIYQPKILTGIKTIENNSILSNFILHQNYPNPFNPETVISYQIPFSSNVELNLYDVLGREISTLVNKEQDAGSYDVKFNGIGLPSGIYIYSLKIGSFAESKKMLLIK